MLPKMSRICFIATVDWPFKMFLNDQISELSKNHEITLVYNTHDTDLKVDSRIIIKHVPFHRKLNPVMDLVTLIKLYLFLNAKKFDMVHTINPKSGLIGCIASFFAGCKIRIHTFTGQVWVTKKGLIRAVLRFMDKVICNLSTHVVADSKSQLEFLQSEKILSVLKGAVPGEGTVGGIDIDRFKYKFTSKIEIRSKYKISNEAFVFLFIGRLNRDKGVYELISSYQSICSIYPNIYLLIVGPDEENIQDQIRVKYGIVPRLIFVPYTNEPQKFFSASDVLCLPSHREGFGTVILEAAAAGIPSIGSDIIGLRDAIIDKETGLLHKVKNQDSLTNCMRYMIEDKEVRLKMAKKGKDRVELYFSQPKVTSVMMDFYKSLI